MKKLNINIELIKLRYILEDKEIAFLIIVFLHYNNIISDEKFLGMLRGLRPIKGGGVDKIPMLRFVRNYQDSITDKWYNDDNFINILEDIFDNVKDNITKKDIPMDNFLKYVNKLLNKNKNFCVDYVYYQIVEPIINKIGREIKDGYCWSGRNLNLIDNSYNDYSLSNKVDNYKVVGYCCEDCDGPYESFRLSGLSNLCETLIVDVIKHFQNELSKYKTENHLKNPLATF